ncbi:ankyrin repeat protein, partial [Mycena galopus ATCC 62051]
VDFSGGTPLFFAAGSGDTELVQFLLASGADPNLQHSAARFPPILFQATNTDVAHLLLDAGANIHAQDNSARNVLAHMMDKPDVSLLQFFLERGVDPNHEDHFKQTPLHHACILKADAAVELLLQFGATTLEKANSNGQTPVHIAM